jgi:hypothetical protein
LRAAKLAIPGNLHHIADYKTLISTADGSSLFHYSGFGRNSMPVLVATVISVRMTTHEWSALLYFQSKSRELL